MFEILAQATSQMSDVLTVNNDVRGFYEDAVRHLEWIIGIGFVVVGIVMPYLIERWRERANKLNEDRLREEIKEATRKIEVVEINLRKEGEDAVKLFEGN